MKLGILRFAEVNLTMPHRISHAMINALALIKDLFQGYFNQDYDIMSDEVLLLE